MANNNLKKIEKLRRKVEEINERVKAEVAKKQEIMKEIEALEAEEMMSACKNSSLTLSEAVESFDILRELKEKGLSYDDLKNFLYSNETLSPMDTKSEEDKDD